MKVALEYLSSLKISIIITNYNYEKYLNKAIDSVLSQSPDELIIVDDGSTDGSVELLNTVDSNVRIIIKENGGQASAMNAGFKVCSGEYVWFLDADDFVLPGAVKFIRETIGGPYQKYHFPLHIVDREGVFKNRTIPSRRNSLAKGIYTNFYLFSGRYVSPPTSGVVYKSQMLNNVFPIPEAEYRICADAYLKEMTGINTLTFPISKPLAVYRIHENNNFYGNRKLTDEQIRLKFKRFSNKHEFLNKNSSDLQIFVRGLITSTRRSTLRLRSLNPGEFRLVFLRVFKNIHLELLNKTIWIIYKSVCRKRVW
ncbi:MAG: hypothetical protein SynsKO_20800 [Synoicihabitans sp.]